MKKFCVVFIVLALALMIPYVAWARDYFVSDITVGMTLYGEDRIIFQDSYSGISYGGSAFSPSDTVRQGEWNVIAVNQSESGVIIVVYDSRYVYVSVSANPTAGGSVSGEGMYDKGGDCGVTATPSTGYHFVNWTEQGAQYSVNEYYDFAVNGSRSLVANFALNNHTISGSANTTAGGTVSGAGNYDYGTSCTLTATPSQGYHFTNWTENGSVVSTSAGYSFTVTGDRALVANFALDQHTISASVYPEASGTVSGAGNYDYGTSCTLTATPSQGYHFTNWTENGTVVSTSASYSFTVTGDRSLVANFALDQHTISASANTTAGGTVSGAGNYDYGSSITLTATPSQGYHFTNWTENGSVVSTSAGYSFTVTGDRALVANFALDQHTISASANPTAGGSASGGGTYNYGSQCTLTATPNVGYSFVNWTENGNPVSTSESYGFTVTGDRTLVANFELNSYDIAAEANPSAGGSVSGGGTYNHGQMCTVSATPNLGYRFDGWEENSSIVSTNQDYSFTAENARNLKAKFTALTGVTLAAVSADHVYTGNPIEVTGSYTCDPDGPVFNGITVLGKGTDVGTYDMDFVGNVIGIVDSTNEYYVKATKKGTLRVFPKELKKGWIKAVPDQTYTGAEIKPALTVYDPVVPQTLVAGKDYTVTYKNNKEIGTATATITGKGNYDGTDSVTFKIVKGKEKEEKEEKDHVHTVVTDEAMAPTCTKTGLTEGSHCSTCKKVLKKQEEIPALDHLFIAWYPDGRGNHIMTCKRKCGYEDIQKCIMFVLPQADPEAAAVSFCPICGYCIGAKLTAVQGLKPQDGAPHGSLRAFSLEAGGKKYMTLAFDYSLTGELLQPAGEVTFSLPEEMKDTAFAVVDSDGSEQPVEKTSENGVRTLKVDFTPEGKAPVKVMVLSVVD